MAELIKPHGDPGVPSELLPLRVRKVVVRAQETGASALVLDGDGVVSWASPSLYSDFEWLASGIGGAHFIELVLAEDANEVHRCLASVHESPFVPTLLLRMRTEGTGSTFCLATFQSLDDDSGGPVTAVIVRSVDERIVDRRDSEFKTSRFQLLAENASDVVFQTGPNLIIQWVSPSVAELFGWESGELIGRSVGELCHPQDFGYLIETIRQIAPGARASAEIRFLKADGDYRWALIAGRRITTDSGETLSYVGSLQDSDTVHRQREELAEAEFRYRILVEATSDIVSVANEFGVIEWISASVADVLGWSPEELVGRDISHIVNPEHVARLEVARQRLTRNEHAELRLQVLRSDRDFRWMQLVVRDVWNDRQQRELRVAGWRDIDAQVRSTAALRETEELYRRLAENVTDVVFLVNPANLLEWVAPSITQALGWLPSELVGRDPVEALIAESDRDLIRTRRGHISDGRNESRVEVRLVDTRGQVHWYLSDARGIVDEGGKLVGTIVSLKAIDDEVVARDALQLSETRYRMLAENTSDVVLSVNSAWEIEWCSPSVSSLLRDRDSGFVGCGLSEVMIDGDWSRLASWRGDVATSLRSSVEEIRVIGTTGEPVWCTIRGVGSYSNDGTLETVVIGLRNCHAEVLERRAHRTLAAAKRVSSSATNEFELLTGLCDAAVSEGGYLLSWYARKVDDSAHSVEKVASSRDGRDYLEALHVSWSDDESGQGPIGRVLRVSRTVVESDLLSAEGFQPWRELARSNGFHSMIAVPVWVAGTIDGSFQVYSGERDGFGSTEVSVMEALATEIGQGLDRRRDHEALVATLREQHLLSGAIYNADECVIAWTPDLTVIFANSSALAQWGLTYAQLVGTTVTIETLSNAESYADLPLVIDGGAPWRGVLEFVAWNESRSVLNSTVLVIHNSHGFVDMLVAVGHPKVG